jgi:hypothetical protein
VTALSDIREHRVSMFDVSESKTLTKELDQYATKSAATEAARSVAKRTGQKVVAGARFGTVKVRPLHRTKKPAKVSEMTLDDVSAVADARKYDEEHYFERGVKALAAIMNPLHPGKDPEERKLAFHKHMHTYAGLEASTECTLPKRELPVFANLANLSARDQLCNYRRTEFLAAAVVCDLFSSAEQRNFRRELKKIRKGRITSWFKLAGVQCEACLGTVSPEEQADVRRTHPAMLRNNEVVFCARCLTADPEAADDSRAARYVRGLVQWRHSCEERWGSVVSTAKTVISEDPALKSLATGDLTPLIILSVLPDSSRLFWDVMEARSSVVEARALCAKLPTTKTEATDQDQDHAQAQDAPEEPDRTALDVVFEDAASDFDNNEWSGGAGGGDGDNGGDAN